jgi:hypothetical protein
MRREGGIGIMFRSYIFHIMEEGGEINVSRKRSLASSSSSLAEWLNKQNNKSMEFLLGYLVCKYNNAYH